MPESSSSHHEYIRMREILDWGHIADITAETGEEGYRLRIWDVVTEETVLELEGLTMSDALGEVDRFAEELAENPPKREIRRRGTWTA